MKNDPELPPEEHPEIIEAVAFPTRARARRKARSETAEESRARQRKVCMALLARWLPVATSEQLAIRKENRGKPVIDEEPLEAALKAGAFILKVLERLARLDGLDAAEKREVTLTEPADPMELARRVRLVAPLLAGRLAGKPPEGIEAAKGTEGIEAKPGK